MKIAIHPFKNSFSERWLKYFEENNIQYKVVDCFSNNILKEMEDCDALMWHWNQEDYRTKLAAISITRSIELIGKKVFPDSNTCWHFDDKIAQKYLLEAINAPLVNSYVFYSRSKALTWINGQEFPKVFKLKGGAGSVNVKLIRNKFQAKRIIKKAFRSGFGASGRKQLFNNRIMHFKRVKNIETFVGLFKGLARLLIPSELERFTAKEKGYVYFQDFQPNNAHDTRVIVIDDKAFAIKRMNREGDFRASGSGLILYPDDSNFDKRLLTISFDVKNKIKAQSIAFDFIYDEDDKPLIVEISYGFAIKGYEDCKGYWDKQLIWHQRYFKPQDFMVQSIIRELKA
jgi:glutathione synthase/RimK-type ligase-like ATP-grasp enzyme